MKRRLLVTDEPDASLFDIPPDYEVIEPRQARRVDFRRLINKAAADFISVEPIRGRIVKSAAMPRFATSNDRLAFLFGILQDQLIVFRNTVK